MGPVILPGSNQALSSPPCVARCRHAAEGLLESATRSPLPAPLQEPQRPLTPRWSFPRSAEPRKPKKPWNVFPTLKPSARKLAPNPEPGATRGPPRGHLLALKGNVSHDDVENLAQVLLKMNRREASRRSSEVEAGGCFSNVSEPHSSPLHPVSGSKTAPSADVIVCWPTKRNFNWLVRINPGIFKRVVNAASYFCVNNSECERMTVIKDACSNVFICLSASHRSCLPS